MINGKKPKGMDEFETPKELYNQLNDRFDFTIDAAATTYNCKVISKITEEGIHFDDGLNESWSGERIFCNPPYSNKFEWIKKAIDEVETHNCSLVVMILPYTMEVMRAFKGTSYHHDVLNKRVSFIDPATGKPAKGNTTGTVIWYLWKEIQI